MEDINTIKHSFTHNWITEITQFFDDSHLIDWRQNMLTIKRKYFPNSS